MQSLVTKKRVTAIITEYWDISHADVFITKMLEGFWINGIHYESTLEIVSMYVDQFPDKDLSRGLSEKHGVPLYDTIEGALLCGGDELNLDGIIIIGEHGEYPRNAYEQTLYPRRLFFEACLNVMLAQQRIIPIFSDKGFAIIEEDIKWMYAQIHQHNIPFMSSSSIPFAFQKPAPPPIPSGAPMYRMFGFSFGKDVDRYAYHTMEMLQATAERRAYGESGVTAVQAYEGEEALAHLLSEEWRLIYEASAGYINVSDVSQFPYTLVRPVFIEVFYEDGLKGGILHADREVNRFVACYQLKPKAPLYITEFDCQWQRPFTHGSIFVMEIERFIHTGRSLYPLERSLITTGVTEAIMRSLSLKERVETPYLRVRY